MRKRRNIFYESKKSRKTLKKISFTFLKSVSLKSGLKIRYGKNKISYMGGDGIEEEIEVLEVVIPAKRSLKNTTLNIQELVEKLKEISKKEGINLFYFETWIVAIPIYKEMYRYWRKNIKEYGKSFKEWFEKLPVEIYETIRDKIVEELSKKYNIEISFANETFSFYVMEKEIIEAIINRRESKDTEDIQFPAYFLKVND